MESSTKEGNKFANLKFEDEEEEWIMLAATTVNGCADGLDESEGKWVSRV